MLRVKALGPMAFYVKEQAFKDAKVIPLGRVIVAIKGYWR